MFLRPSTGQFHRDPLFRSLLVEVPVDVAFEEVAEESFDYQSSRRVSYQGDPRDVEAAAKALCQAKYPVIHAGQGVMYAKATDELLELAELLKP